VVLLTHREVVACLRSAKFRAVQLQVETVMCYNFKGYEVAFPRTLWELCTTSVSLMELVYRIISCLV
jgi:hypothetical protein